MPILSEDEAIKPNDPTYNQRIHFWNRLYRGSLIALLLLIVAIVTSVAVKVDNTTRSTKLLLEQFQKSTLEARANNVARQNQMEDYIRCLVLLRFDVPAKQLTTRKGTESALYKCANKE